MPGNLANAAKLSPPSPITQPPGNPYRHRRSSVLEALPGGGLAGLSSLRSPANPQDAREVQNARALQVLARVKEKLTGRDFPASPPGADDGPGQRLFEGSHGGGMAELGALVAAAALDAGGMMGQGGGLQGVERRAEGELLVAEQVKKLIKQATSTENLCQHYIGWCSFW